MNTPYATKSGLQIGRYYQPNLRRTFTYDEQRIQDALLNKRTGGLLERVAAFIWRLL